MLHTNSVITVYNPANIDPQELINDFVIREKEYKRILDDIAGSKMEHPEQHYIIQGQRGYGKTTLLLRLFYEIEKDISLKERFSPVIFTEEQYNLRTLEKLWEHIAAHLAEDEKFQGIDNEMEKLEKDDDYEAKCFKIIEKYLKNNHKKLILFIDNIGDIFNKFKEKENHRLREVLITSAEIRIIGASSIVLEQTYDYSKPFFDFFKIVDLKGLSQEETEKLLLKLGKKVSKEDEENVKNIIDKNPERVESLRRLTGGVPRTIVLLFEVFIDNKNGNSFKDLEMVLDKVTPLYKHRMDDLSPQQQEIVDVIAMNWDAVSTKYISEKTRMESKAVSAQLKELEKNRIVQKIETSKKNHLYQVLERFFNIWYLIRYGRRKDKTRVQWLVQFLEIWCDKEELLKRAEKHIEAVNLTLYQTESNKEDALKLAEKAVENERNIFNLHTLAMILLWNDKLEESIKISQEFLNNEEMVEKYSEDVITYLLFLIAKKQYNYTLKIFSENEFNFKDRFKPVYYALMYFMKDKYPDEYKKMGSELKQTVDEIIEKIVNYSKKEPNSPFLNLFK